MSTGPMRPPKRIRLARKAHGKSYVGLDADSPWDDEEFTISEEELEAPDPDDYYGEPKERYPYSRPGFRKGLYDYLVRENKNDHKGKLICQLCGDEIHLDASGYETGPSVASYKNRGRPQIDHYKPDWVGRVKIIKQWVAHKGQKVEPDEIRKWVIKEYNRMPLRVVHKKCNLSRPKSHA